MTPAQIRKDLSYFGRFGKQGRGYNVKRLLEELHQILGLDRKWSMVVVGVGQLGHAVLSYGGFAPQGFHIIEAFDADPPSWANTIGDLVIKPVSPMRGGARGQHRGYRHRGNACGGGAAGHRRAGGVRRAGDPELRAHRPARAEACACEGHRSGAILAVHDLLPEGPAYACLGAWL